ncbi:MAG: class I SAM-dependent methyltransferase, partial [Endozoicomonadaceae bacterium]|nr:class I SAM-dependent methyltransferase [Endozoicomonadaceae bacterium]
MLPPVEQDQTVAVLQSEYWSTVQSDLLAKRCCCMVLPDQPVTQITSVPYVVSMNAAYQLYVKKTGYNKLGAVWVDFCSSKLHYRQHAARIRQEALIKAIGVLESKATLRVLDCTAGLGVDGFLLASAGCQVNLLERSPIISALLENGLYRASQTVSLSHVMKRLSLQMIEAKNYLKKLIKQQEFDKYDVIYLDPMFSSQANTKSAVKKNMQYLRDLLPVLADIDLLALAYQIARYRVVVKRPRLSPLLNSD